MPQATARRGAADAGQGRDHRNRRFRPPITLTGVIAAQIRTDLSFRLSGKISERLANVGDHVVAEPVLARLDPDEQQAELVSAKAGVASAEAMVRQTAAAFERQKDLLGRGNTTRRDYDQAEAVLRSAQAQLDQAQSDLSWRRTSSPIPSCAPTPTASSPRARPRPARWWRRPSRSTPWRATARATRCSTSMNGR